MKILLFGEYSNLHWTLAQGLKALGHHVVVASDGDGFKNHNRDIDLSRSNSSIYNTFKTVKSVYNNLDNFKNYDVVQLINPCFTPLSVEINTVLYNYLRKHNKKVFLGAFGDDAYWLKACVENKIFRYSEFFVNNKENSLQENLRLKKLWSQGTSRERLNTDIANSSDGIIACLYEYFEAYKPFFSNKLQYIPLPVNLTEIKKTEVLCSDKIIFFVGINKARNKFKGTDRLYHVLTEIEKKYSNQIEVKTVQSLQYSEYLKTITKVDVILDQLYSYSPAMNGLLSLASGKVLVGGGEPEMYNLLSEKQNRPIINVFPSEDDIYKKLENIILNKQEIPTISDNGRVFVEKHHDHIKVAQQYVDFWTQK
ncbi:MAG: hypothetical protein RL662_915 [Bacteroidota bacterium]|jgi:hypothetical protein